MRSPYDIVVVGGGMVGCAVAALLADAAPDVRLLVIEAGPRPSWDPADAFDLRVSAVSEASRRILTRAGAWPAIAGGRICPYRQMMVWDAADHPGGKTNLVFDCAEVGEPVLGHIIENRLMRTALIDTLERRGVEMRFEAALESVSPGPEHVELGLAGGDRLRGRLVAGVDGAASPVRHLAGLRVLGANYGQEALVAHVRFSSAHGEVARQRFLEAGPLALLPLADGRCSIVWSMGPEDCGRLKAVAEADFLQELTSASQGVLGPAVGVGPRAAFPLKWQHAPDYARPRVVLAGDAAHAVHPLAGQGVNLGFLDAAVLAEVLGPAVADGRDPGDLALLRRYERRRKGENLLAMQSFTGLNRLFSNASGTVSMLRRAGLAAVSATPTLRRAFMRRAMGLAGDLPAVAMADPA
jgi:2-octaprenylphenol hydroxylase